MKKVVLSLLISLLAFTVEAQEVSDVTERAYDLYESLQKQKARAALKKFNDSSRKQWSLNPKKKRGISIAKVKDFVLVDSLMAGVLDKRFAYEKMGYIFQQFGKEDYYICFYGEPHPLDPWGFSIEGPYVSMNFTIVEKHFSFTPFLIGANPSFIPREGKKPLDIMSTQDGIPADLMTMFDEAQLGKVMVSEKAPSKMKYGLMKKLAFDQEGMSFQEFEGENQTTFMSMATSVYFYCVQKHLNREIYARFGKYKSSQLKMAWEGPIESDQVHGYRITTPTILMEYINLEANKNNAYCVLREIGYDFGEGYLK